LIELIDVCKKFKKRILFSNLNLKITSCGVYSFIGDNGIGKTTLLNIISKNIKVNSGKVINTHKGISFVSQKVNLIEHLTVKEHLDIYKIKHSVLKKYNLLSKLNNYPSELSLGQKQRLGCIIGLYCNSSLLIIDEPTSHLDSGNSRLLFEEIKKVSKTKIVLLVSHNIDLIYEYSDLVYKIEDHKLNLIKNNYIDNKKIVEKRTKLKFRKYIKKSLKYNKKINSLFVVIVFAISFLFLLTKSISSSLSGLIEEEIKYSLDYNKFYLKECDSINKKGVIIKKCSNLSDNKLMLLKKTNHRVGYNLDVVMNTLYDRDNFSVISCDKYTLKDGRYPLKYNEILTNENYRVGDIITIETSKIISYKKTDIYSTTLNLNVVGTIESKHLFEDDKYYLDYDLLSKYLNEQRLINNNIDLFTYFQNLEIDTYKYVLYFDDIDVKLLENNNIDFLSSSYEYYESLKSLNSEIKYYLRYINYFTIPLCLYYFLKLLNKKMASKQKEILFLKANLVNKRTILKLINKEQCILIIFSFILSLLITNVFIYLFLNNISVNIVDLIMVLIFLLLINRLSIKATFKRRISI